MGAFRPGGQDFAGLEAVPGVGALAGKQIDDGAIGRLGLQYFAAAGAEKDGDGDAPDALARDAPIRTGGDHVGNALFAPGRVPLDFFDLVERHAAQRAVVQLALHGNKPLFGGPEDDWIVAAPAMRVGVLDVLAAKQHASRFEELNDRFVGFENSQAVILGQSVKQVAGAVDVARLVDAVLDSGVEVVGAVRGSGMNRAGALVHGHIVGQHAEDLAIEKRMGEGYTLKSGAGKTGNGE